ncbi:MAG: hypothetical protein JWL63_359 [Rhodocyclales bacterium]|nr:hypothetical protein [Rhodocyclales bacterium]
MKFRMAVIASLLTILMACGGGGGAAGGGTSSTDSLLTSANNNVVSGNTPVISGNTPNNSSSSSSSSNASSAPNNGNNSSTASSAGASSSTSAVWTSVPPSPGQITAVSSDGVIAANSVITFGQAFKPGEMTTAVSAAAGSTSLATQTDVKRRHPDGSIRHAIVSVRLPATNGPLSFALSPAATTTGTGVSLAQALASSVDYRVEIAETGGTLESALTWSTTLKQALGASHSQWIAGPLVTEWRSRVAPKSLALIPHPGLRVLFDARYQSPTQGRVSIAIENVEATAGRGDRQYNLRIYDASNAVVYSVDNLKHYAQTRHRKILYFGAGSKEMMAIVDIERLKNARAIPNYADITIPASTINSQYVSWQGSQRGLYQSSIVTAYMPTTGGRSDIGPLPGWTATALISRDPRAYQIMFDQAERAAYFSVHYFDPATHDFYNLDIRPTFSLYVRWGHTPYPGGDESIEAGYRLLPTLLASTTPDGWQQDSAHEPSLAYLPYIITGDHYYLDELYHWADYHFLAKNAGYRGLDQGLFYEGQTREQAWSLRTLGHAAWIAPDADWQRDYFTSKLNNNIAWYRANVLPTNSLGYGFGLADGTLPEGSNQVIRIFAPWQHHFMAYTLSELCDHGYAATDVRDFALGFSTRLFTSGAAYNRMDGTAYYLPGQLTGGAYINSMSAMYYHAFVNRTTPVATQLEAYNSPDGYAIEALTALSASIDANITNASAGYVFVRDQIMQPGAGNQQQFVINPTWNIVPRGAVSGLAEAPGIYVR